MAAFTSVNKKLISGTLCVMGALRLRFSFLQILCLLNIFAIGSYDSFDSYDSIDSYNSIGSYDSVGSQEANGSSRPVSIGLANENNLIRLVCAECKGGHHSTVIIDSVYPKLSTVWCYGCEKNGYVGRGGSFLTSNRSTGYKDTWTVHHERVSLKELTNHGFSSRDEVKCAIENPDVDPNWNLLKYASKMCSASSPLMLVLEIRESTLTASSRSVDVQIGSKVLRAQLKDTYNKSYGRVVAIITHEDVFMSTISIQKEYDSLFGLLGITNLTYLMKGTQNFFGQRQCTHMSAELRWECQGQRGDIPIITDKFKNFNQTQKMSTMKNSLGILKQVYENDTDLISKKCVDYHEKMVNAFVFGDDDTDEEKEQIIL